MRTILSVFIALMMLCNVVHPLVQQWAFDTEIEMDDWVETEDSDDDPETQKEGSKVKESYTFARNLLLESHAEELLKSGIVRFVTSHSLVSDPHILHPFLPPEELHTR